MKSIILCIFFFGFLFTSNSQLNLVNNQDKEFKVAIAYFHSSYRFSGWVSKGWITIQPNEKIKIFEKNPREKYVYYYAISATDTISGYKNILVSPSDTFFIEHAIMKATAAEHPEYQWFKFREIKRGKFSKYHKEFDLIIGD